MTGVPPPPPPHPARERPMAANSANTGPITFFIIITPFVLISLTSRSLGIVRASVVHDAFSSR
jgi:hypothetical protein